MAWGVCVCVRGAMDSAWGVCVRGAMDSGMRCVRSYGQWHEVCEELWTVA